MSKIQLYSYSNPNPNSNFRNNSLVFFLIWRLIVSYRKGFFFNRKVTVASRAQVHLRIQGALCNQELLIQPKAPVISVAFANPRSVLDQRLALEIIDNYATTLEIFAQLGRARRFRPRPFNDRVDASLVMLIRNCVALHTVAIRERFSTQTALLVAHFVSYKKDFHFYLRRNALLKRSNDWPKSAEWTSEFHQWLRKTAKSYCKLTRFWCKNH